MGTPLREDLVGALPEHRALPMFHAQGPSLGPSLGDNTGASAAHPWRLVLGAGRPARSTRACKGAENLEVPTCTAHGLGLAQTH